MSIERVYRPGRRAGVSTGAYLASLWRSRHFMVALARSEQRASHARTVLGAVWTVLDPLLLAGVYFVLIGLLRGGLWDGTERLTLIVAGVILFTYTRQAVNDGARSVLNNGKLLLSTTFPRALLPTTAVVSAAIQLVPGLAIYAVIHVATGRPVSQSLLLLPVVLAIHTVFNLGASLCIALVGAVVPDVQSTVGYAMRIWLYLTPVLYTADTLSSDVRTWLAFNPLYPLFEAYHDLLSGSVPSATTFAAATAWAVGSFCVGFAVFTSQEGILASRL